MKVLERKTLIRWIVFIVLIASIVWGGLNYRHGFDVESLRQTIDGYGILAPLVFIGIYIIAVVLFLPGSVVTMTGGFIFGPVKGILFNIIGATIGASFAFLIARYLASDWVAQKTGGQLKTLLQGVEREGWRFVAIVRLIPLIPFNLLNYALGLTKIRIIHYILASAIFILPGTVAYTYLGSLGHAALRGAKREAVINGLIAFSVLVILGFLPGIVKRFRKNKKNNL